MLHYIKSKATLEHLVRRLINKSEDSTRAVDLKERYLTRQRLMDIFGVVRFEGDDDNAVNCHTPKSSKHNPVALMSDNGSFALFFYAGSGSSHTVYTLTFSRQSISGTWDVDCTTFEINSLRPVPDIRSIDKFIALLKDDSFIYRLNTNRYKPMHTLSSVLWKLFEQFDINALVYSRKQACKTRSGLVFLSAVDDFLGSRLGSSTCLLLYAWKTSCAHL